MAEATYNYDCTTARPTLLSLDATAESADPRAGLWCVCMCFHQVVRANWLCLERSDRDRIVWIRKECDMKIVPVDWVEGQMSRKELR